MRNQLYRALLLCLVLSQPCLGQLSPEQELFRKAASKTRAEQRDVTLQRELRKVVLQAITLYCHHLDSLACQDLFSVGDPDLYRQALVNVDGSLERNVIYVEGYRAPRHEDGGPYVLPADFWRAYLPLDPEKNTLWHEAQHELLCQAGMSGALYSQDSHHNLIEGIGERGAEAFATLRPFEKELRKAAEETRGKTLTLEQERAYWGTAQVCWRRFTLAEQRVRKIGAVKYRELTGTYYGTLSQVQNWYQEGKLTLADGTPVRPPAWVFESPGLIPADIDTIANPPVARGTSWESSVGLSIKGGGQVVAQGNLRIQLMSDDPLCGLRVSQNGVKVPGIAGPGGASTRLFDVDLSKGQPLEIVFVHLRTDKLESVEYPVALTYSDPGSKRRYSDTEREYVFKPASTAPLSLEVRGGRRTEPGKALHLTAVLAGDKTGLHEVFWYDETRNIGLGSGESIDFQADDRDTYTLNVKARVRREGQLVTAAETRISIEVGSPPATPSAPPSSPDKPVVHLSSNIIMASDFFTIWVDLPAWMASKAVEFTWSVGALTNGPRAELQLDASDVGQALGVVIRDARGEELGKAYVVPGTYQTVAGKFSFQAPASWKITERANGYILSAGSSLEIDERLSKDGANARATGSAGGGSLTISWLSNDDMRDINGGKAGPREWTCQGDPRSRVLRTKGGMGYEIAITRSSYLMTDGDSRLRDQLKSKWDPQVQAHRERFDKEIDALLASLTVTPEGRVERVHDPPLPEAGAMSVRLEGVRGTYRPGEESLIRAVVENVPAGAGALQYQWAGSVVGKGPEVKLVAPAHSEKGNVSVTVRGKSGALAVAQAEFSVVVTQVTLSKEPSGPLALGDTVTLTAATDAKGQLSFQFEPADLGFETNGTPSSQTRLRLSKVGSWQVWVKVLDGSGTVMAESQPLSLEVAPGQLRIDLSQPSPRVGETVTASVAGLPRETPLEWELPAHLQEIKREGATLTLRPLEGRAAEVRVKALSGKQELGRGAVTLTAREYAVNIQVEEGQLLSGSPVRLAAAIDPVAPDPLEYNWSAQSGLSLVGTSRGAQVTVQAAQSGSYKVAVEAGDGKGAIYGRAEFELALASGAGKAKALLGEARQAAEKGDFEQAAALGQKAAAIDPQGSASELSKLAEWLSDRGWQAALGDDYTTAKGALKAASGLAPDDGRIAKRLKKVLKAEVVWPQVQQLGAECRRLVDARRMRTAYPVYSEVVRLSNDLCYERMDMHPYARSVSKYYLDHQEEFNRYQLAAESRVRELWSNPAGYQEILDLADGMDSWELIPATKSQVDAWRAEALAMRERATALVVEVTPLQSQAAVGGQVQMTARVRGGVPPYAYEWKVGGQLTAVSTPTALWTLERVGDYSFQVVVRDSQGRTASAECRARATGALRAWVDPSIYAATPGVAFKTVAHAEGGVPPYRFEWFVGQERSGMVNQVNVWTLNSPGVYTLRAQVTDATGAQVYAECTATLPDASQPAQPPGQPPATSGSRVTAGTTSAGTSYPANCHGDPFNGGSWCNARNGSDWLQRDFGALYGIREIRIHSAGSDVTSENSSIVIKVLNAQGQWVVVDTFQNTNINLAKLTGGAQANSIPPYRRAFSPPLGGRAIRIELSGHGWFGVSDVVVMGELVAGTPPAQPPSLPPVQPPSHPPVQPPTGAMVLGVLENTTAENIHIFAAGESFDPSNRLTPGQSRQVSLRVPADGRIEFIAGRSGQVLQRKVWTGDPADLSRYPRVRWTSEGLVITTGLR